MKCHLCQKTLQFIPDDPYIQPGEPSTWECPDMHATIELDRFDDSIIVAYKLYWDGDLNARERFRITAKRHTDHWTKQHTVLYKRSSPPESSYARFPSWNAILTLDHFFELQIKDNIIQADNLIPRLLKLRAFS